MDPELTELAIALNRFSDRIDRLERVSSTSQVSISAGGVGVWVATMAAFVCFVMMMVMLVLYVDQSRKVDDLGHYLQAIYAQAPSLKPEEDQ
jgi:hypothetical protein